MIRLTHNRSSFAPKKGLHNWCLLGLLWAILGGCSGFLEQLPDDRVVLDSPDKLREILVYAYPGACYAAFCEGMSDNADDKGPNATFDATNTQAFVWAENYQEVYQESPAYYWSACYGAISHANHALELIDGLSPEEAKKYNPQKGEALVARAYAHLMLVSLWAKHYHPTHAKNDLGIPYVTKPEKTVLVDYTRNTVQEVYDALEQDIVIGVDLINDEIYGATPRFHFNTQAAAALAVRYYLYRGDAWHKLIQYADRILPDNENAIAILLRDWNGKYTEVGYFGIQQTYSRPTENANLLIDNQLSWYARKFWGYRFSMTPDVRQIFSLTPFAQRLAYTVYGGNELVYNIPKYVEYFQLSSLNANTGLGYVSFPVFTIEEVLLSRAEAYVMIGDYAKAHRDLNAFFSRRVLNYDRAAHNLREQDVMNYIARPGVSVPLRPHYALDAKQTAYIQFILDMRRKEFFFEGMRWFDIRRFYIPVTHKLFVGTDFQARTDADYQALTLGGIEDPKRQLQIPQRALRFGLQPNPR